MKVSSYFFPYPRACILFKVVNDDSKLHVNKINKISNPIFILVIIFPLVMSFPNVFEFQ